MKWGSERLPKWPIIVVEKGGYPAKLNNLKIIRFFRAQTVHKRKSISEQDFDSRVSDPIKLAR